MDLCSNPCLIVDKEYIYYPVFSWATGHGQRPEKY